MTPTELTQVERQILANQHLILAKLNEDKDDYEYKSNLMKREILIKGLTGEYHEIFDVYSDEVSFDICQETSDILNMYRRINNVIARLTESEKEELELDLEEIKFEGFDGNSDDHYGYTNFIIENLDKWKELKDTYLNSHSSFSIKKYRKMLSKQNELLKDKVDLDVNDLKEIIKSI